MFTFTLPTTSSVSFISHYTSTIYPSLPITCTTHRGILRDTLKHHKRLSPSAQKANLKHIISLITEYLPYLLFLQKALQSGQATPIVGSPELTTEWRSVLSASPRFTKSVREPPRRQGIGIEYEIFWVLSTLAYANSLQARALLGEYLVSSSSSGTDNAQLMRQSINHLLTSASIFNYLLSLPSPGGKQSNSDSTKFKLPIDISEQLLSSLSSACLASATLLSVLKSDPYPSYLALTSTSTSHSSSSNNRDYLYTPPPPPTGVKALLFSRICIAASEHASRAQGAISSIGNGEVKEEYISFLKSLERVSKARGCRFLGIDAEATGRVGEGIGWVKLGKKVLEDSRDLDQDAEKQSSLSSRMEKLKMSSSKKTKLHISEQQQRPEGDIPAQLDPFNLNSEKFTLNALDSKWSKLNNSVMFQSVTPLNTLAAKIPGGREVHTLGEFIPPSLEPDDVERLGRSTVGEGEARVGTGEESGKGMYWPEENTVVDSSDEECGGRVEILGQRQDERSLGMPGAFASQGGYY